MRFTLAVGAVVCSAANDIAGDGGDHTGGWLRPLIWEPDAKIHPRKSPDAPGGAASGDFLGCKKILISK